METQLWDSVCKTDPAHTKKFTKGGGFSGTAIKPFYLMHKATQTFGVCGIGWGWDELENKVVGGVWCSKVELWFNYNNQRGAIQQWGQTVMQGTNKHGAFVDEEAPKKAVTDAVTKCLSYLGFAGDVHMGLFDDSKYVDERVKEEKQESAAAQGRRLETFKEALLISKNPTKFWNENKDIIEFCETSPEPEMAMRGMLLVAKDSLKRLIAESNDPAETWEEQFSLIKPISAMTPTSAYKELVEAGAARKAYLAGLETQKEEFSAIPKFLEKEIRNGKPQ